MQRKLPPRSDLKPGKLYKRPLNIPRARLNRRMFRRVGGRNGYAAIYGLSKENRAGAMLKYSTKLRLAAAGAFSFLSSM